MIPGWLGWLAGLGQGRVMRFIQHQCASTVWTASPAVVIAVMTTNAEDFGRGLVVGAHEARPCTLLECHCIDMSQG